MKKFLATLTVLFTVLCLSVIPAQAKWKGEAGAGVGGHFGQITIELSTIAVDLVGEVLVPGWTGSFDIDVTNTANSIPVVLSYRSDDKPEYLTITTDIDSVPPTLQPGVTETVTVNLSIADDSSSDLQDTDMYFTMTFVEDQE